MRLQELLRGVQIKENNGINREKEITTLCTDSRKCTPGALFIAVEGAESDGHNYIDAAIENGATTIVCQREVERREGIDYLLAEGGREMVATIASNFYGNPSKELNLVGVTGTNGKTSIATLLYRLFTKLGYSCGLLSTIANYVGEKRYETINTTPGPIELNALLRQMANSGCEYCFMEVSSHALDQQRTAGLHFRGAIFTNLTHDHLDYHKSFANYLACKKSLFDNLPKEAFALVNADDRNGKVMVQNCKAQISTYSCRGYADFCGKVIEKSIEGMLLRINGTEVWCRFIGMHNASNLTAIYGAAILLGAESQEVIRIMSELTSVAGRLEYFIGPRNIIAVVDYAHTPDALENVLRTLADLKPAGELICLFGCGGNRDKSKRPEMGAIAGKYADRIVVTSENPRFEDPAEIMNDIKAGMERSVLSRSLFIADRREAIRTAIIMAKESSIVLVAGKGHEDYQIIAGVKHHLDDREIIKELFNELKG